jgi:hypothetical protein
MLVEADPAEAQALIAGLADPRAGPCNVEWVTLLTEGVERSAGRMLFNSGASMFAMGFYICDSRRPAPSW